MKVKKLTPKQAASHFNVHIKTLRDWDKQGKIKKEKIYATAMGSDTQESGVMLIQVL